VERVLLFIPGYNCEQQIVRTLGQLDSKILPYLTEIIMVNNRSTDHTEEAVQRFGEQHPALPLTLLRNDQNYGLGGSHKVAFQYAIDNAFDYTIVLHGDDQADIHDLLPIFESGEHRKHDCCMGARFAAGSHLVGYSGFRTFGNRVYNLLFSVVLHKNLKELGSSLKIYKVEMLTSRFFMKFKDNLSFDYCMTLASGYYKQDYLYFPITFREEDQISNVKLFDQAINVLKMLGKYMVNPRTYIQSELRDQIHNAYTSQTIYRYQKGGETV